MLEAGRRNVEEQIWKHHDLAGGKWRCENASYFRVNQEKIKTVFLNFGFSGYLGFETTSIW